MKKTFKFEQSGCDFDCLWRPENRALQRRAFLCVSTVRSAFGIGRSKAVEFDVTNRKPKGGLAGWHILKKLDNEIWVLTTSTYGYTPYLTLSASDMLDHFFPKNVTLYVSAYTNVLK
jgi:hypothetical protein